MIGEGDSAGFGVEGDVTPADFVAEPVEFGLGGDAPLMEEEAPCAKERAYGDVKCAVGFSTPVEGAVEEAKGLGIGDHWSRTGFAADARELTGGAVVAEESFEAIDFVEGQVHVLFSDGLVGYVEVDGEDGTHRSVGLVEVLERSLRARGESARSCER